MMGIKKLAKSIWIIPLLLPILPETAAANSAFNTYTASVDGSIIQTQQAYEVMAILSMPEIGRPEDMFIDGNNNLYIADSANGYILVLDGDRNMARVVGSDYLSRPTGVAVNEHGDVFVADTEHVFQFTADGRLVNRFGRPDDDIFGSTAPFLPRKLALDFRGNIYIVGEAANNGLIVLTQDGEFFGYFGANLASLTFFQTLQNLFTPKENRRFLNLPTPPTNLAIDDRGNVHTVTSGFGDESIQKLNIAGNNILNPSGWLDIFPVDIAIGKNGNLTVISSLGGVAEYTPTGDLLFYFGELDNSAQRPGIFRQPTSIAVDTDGNLYVSDADSSLIHIFVPTEFAYWVHLAMSDFEAGRYLQSTSYWGEVLRFHSAFSFADLAIGQALFLNGNFDEALDRIYLARHKEWYSQVFWEIRNAWLLRHSAVIIVAFVFAFFVVKGMRVAGRKTGYDKIVAGFYRQKIDNKVFRELSLLFKILRHPLDTFYDIKHHGKSSVLTATLIYLMCFVVFSLSYTFTGFLFRWNFYQNLPELLAIFLVIITLFVVVSYLVSSVNDGEGSFVNMYISCAYAMSPFLLASVPIIFLSMILTQNESFVYSLVISVSIVWTVLLQFIMVKEIQDYSIRDTVKNIVLTVFGGVVVVFVVFVLYLLLQQVYEFAKDIIWELWNRA